MNFRLESALRRTQANGTRLLVLYLTLGDPLTTATMDIARAALDAGADVLELGIPTPTTNPRGAVIAESFRRVGSASPHAAFELMSRFRDEFPDTALVPLIYPQTVADIGMEQLTAAAVESGADGLVLTAVSSPEQVAKVVADGLHAIPLVSLPDRSGLEVAADLLTYRTVSEITGAQLDCAALRETVDALAQVAAKPFLAGFGISSEAEITAISRSAAGVVIGSRFHVLLAQTAPTDRVLMTTSTLRRWKAATRLL